MAGDETIFALSSGAPPAAIGVIRISGPAAAPALEALTGHRPAHRRPSLRLLQDPKSGEALDKALTLFFPGPDTATGEDLAELHCHGGRAVIVAVEGALQEMDGLRKAEAGEFTRRAYTHGVMDLAEAEGLSDLLFAETEAQRRHALHMAGGALSHRIAEWQQEILRLSAMVEAELDFSDEDDVAEPQIVKIAEQGAQLAGVMMALLVKPRAERLQEGVRVVLGGPPNSGKSTLLNALVERDAAIVSDIAGTTRDVIAVPVALGGLPFVITDTAGLRDRDAQEIERIGMERAQQAFAGADIILWLGPEGQGPSHDRLIEIASKADRKDFSPKSQVALVVAPPTGQGLDALAGRLIEEAQHIVPAAHDLALNERQAALLKDAADALADMTSQTDPLIVAEQLRLARKALDAITGQASTEDMLDGLFGRFCIGK